MSIFLEFLCWQRYHSAGEDRVKQGRKSSPRFFDALSTDGNGEILTIAYTISSLFFLLKFKPVGVFGHDFDTNCSESIRVF